MGESSVSPTIRTYGGFPPEVTLQPVTSGLFSRFQTKQLLGFILAVKLRRTPTGGSDEIECEAIAQLFLLRYRKRGSIRSSGADLVTSYGTPDPRVRTMADINGISRPR